MNTNLQDKVRDSLSRGRNSKLEVSLLSYRDGSKTPSESSISARWIERETDLPPFPRKWSMSGDNPPTPITPEEWEWWENLNFDPRFIVKVNSQDALAVGHAEFIFPDGTTWRDHAKYTEREVNRSMREDDFSSACAGYGLRGSEPQNVQISKRAY